VYITVLSNVFTILRDYVCELLILVLLYIELLDNGIAGTKHAVVNNRNN